ncbi:MAG: hypothetical protein V1664_01110 [Candidatus Uhrbacteria bacterium]
MVIQGKQALYEAVEPAKLQDLIDFKMKEVEDLRGHFKQAVSSLLSMYNLSTGRPTVRMFEGLEGLEKSIEETLEAKTDICTYIDIAALTGELAQTNAQYVRRRINKKINKRILVTDTPEARAFFAKQNTPYTQVGFLKGYPAALATAMEIYDGRVSYFTLTSDKKISVIINDPLIYRTHLVQFEWLWQMAEKISYAAAASAADGTGSAESASNNI